MKILITGGTGFLGRHCAIRLHSLGHIVTALGRNELTGAEFEKRGIRFINADLSDNEAIHSAFANQEQIIHAGALNARWGNYSDFYRANVLGTQHVIDASLAHGVQRLVHLSTSSIYFNYRNRLLIRESEALPKPTSTYAATKRMADNLINTAAERGLSCITLCPKSIIGPGDHNVLGRILKAANSGSIYLPNGGQSLVDPSCVDNVVDAVLLALNAPESACGKKFNISNGEPLKLRQMVDLLADSIKRPINIRSIPYPVAYTMASVLEFGYGVLARREPPLTREITGLMAKSQTLDISAARDILGYKPRINLIEGIKGYAHWWQRCNTGKASYAERIGL